MDTRQLLLVGVIGVLAVFSLGIAWYCFLVNKKINQILEKGNIKDFKDIFMSQKDKNAELEEKIKEGFARIKELEAIAKKSIQKTAVIRFDPFNEMGGKQSSTIAFLDKEDNGVVLSSLFLREGNRVYTKTIQKGKSDILLSQEEEEALRKAMEAPAKPAAKRTKTKKKDE